MKIQKLIKQKIITNKNDFIAISFLFFLSLSILIAMKGNFYTVWDRILTPFNPSLAVLKDIYVWDFLNAVGRYYVYLGHLVYHFLVFLLSLVFPPNVANNLLFFSLFFSSGSTMYLFMRSFNWSRKKYLIPFIAAVSYMFNPFWSFRLYSAPYLIFIVAFLPLLTYLLKKMIDQGLENKSKLTINVISFSLITFLMTTGFAEIAAGLMAGIFVFMFGLFYALIQKKVKIFTILLSLLFIVSLITHLWWVYPNLQDNTIKDAMGKKGQYLVDAIASLRIVSEPTQYHNTLRAFSYYKYSPRSRFTGNALSIRPALEDFYHSKPAQFALFFLPLTILLGFLFAKENNKKFYLLFLPILVILIPIFFAAFNPPFGKIVLWMVKHNPLFVFRRPSVCMFTVQFIFSVLLAVSFESIFNKIKERCIEKYRKKIVISFIIGFILLILFLGLPQFLFKTAKIDLYDFQDDLVQVSMLSQPPDYVEQTVDYLSTMNNTSGVVILPKVGSMRAYNWEHGFFGWDVYNMMLNRPTLSHYRYGFMYPNDQIYNYLQSAINSNQTKKFQDILILNDIKYVIFADDALQWGPKIVNKSRDKTFLDSNPNLVFLKRFGKHYIYTTNFSSSAFYTVSEGVYIAPIYKKINLSNLIEQPAEGSDQFVDYINGTLYLSYNYSQFRKDKRHYAVIFKSGLLDNKQYNALKIALKNDGKSTLKIACAQEDKNVYLNHEKSYLSESRLLQEKGYSADYYSLQSCKLNDELIFILRVSDTEKIGMKKTELAELEFNTDFSFSIVDAFEKIIKVNGVFNMVVVNSENCTLSNNNNLFSNKLMGPIPTYEQVNLSKIMDSPKEGSDMFLNYGDEGLTLKYNYTEFRKNKSHFATVFQTNLKIKKGYLALNVMSRTSDNSNLRVSCKSQKSFIYLTPQTGTLPKYLEQKAGYSAKVYNVSICDLGAPLRFVLGADASKIGEYKVKLINLSFITGYINASESNPRDNLTSYELEKVKIQIKQLSPVNYELYLSNAANKEFILASTIVYDESWDAEIEEGKANISKIKINGDYNGWKIQSDKDELVLDVYYQKQKMVNKLMIFSGSFLIFEIIILLILVIIKRKKIKESGGEQWHQ